MESDTLLEQYKRCTKINQEQLKQARNIEDLVNIKIQALDKALLNSDHTYNFYYDPVVFRQQVPCMGERDFLISQALLLKGAQRAKPQAPFNVQNELFREKDLMDIKKDINVSIAHAGLDIIKSRDPLYKSEMKRLEMEDAKNNGFVQKPEGAAPTGAEEDPIAVLKQLFKPQGFGNKILDKNHIANKYRMKYLADMKKEKKRQQAQQLKLHKKYQEDQDVQMYQEGPPSSVPSDRHQRVNRIGLNQKLEEPPITLQKQMTFKDEHLDEALVDQLPTRKDATNYQTTAQQLKNRLDSLRQMFDDDDQAHYRVQKGYFENTPILSGLPDYEYDTKIQRNVGDRRKERRGIQSQDTSLYPSDTEIAEQQQDLRVFLTNKIQELKDKMSANQEILDLSSFPSEQPVQSKFKVSKLNDIQSIRVAGTSQKLEEQFNNRVTRAGVDFNFRNALLSQEKKANQKIVETVSKFNEVHQQLLMQQASVHNSSVAGHTPSVEYNQFSQVPMSADGNTFERNDLEQANNPKEREVTSAEYHTSTVENQIPLVMTPPSVAQAAARHLASAPENFQGRKQQQKGLSSSRDYKSAKYKNFVFAQMMKIDQIDREITKKNKEKKQEVKNKDIEQLIRKTKKQIRVEEGRQDSAEKGDTESREMIGSGRGDETGGDYNRIYYEHDDLDNMIDSSNGGHKDIMQSLNQYASQNYQNMSAGNQLASKSYEEDQQQNQLVDPPSERHGTASPLSESRGGSPPRPSMLNMQPFSSNRAVHVINSPITDPNTFSKANGTIMASQGSLEQNQTIHKSSKSKDIHDHLNGGSLTDSEDYIQRTAQKILARQHKKQAQMGLKTSLYEIREEGYQSHTSSTGVSHDPFRMTFSSKRFNRYPRFTIFLKKNAEGLLQNKYAIENTISLNPQFLSYLQEAQSSVADNIENQQFLEEQQKEQGIIITNEKKREMIKIDPFEKVVLVKGIDNSILTSFRTLRKQNNIVSDTLKVIHNKFQPFSNKSSTFMILSKQSAGKLPYPLTDDEDTVQLAAAQLLSQNLKLKTGSTGLSREEERSIQSPQTIFTPSSPGGPHIEAKQVSPQKQQSSMHANQLGVTSPNNSQMIYSLILGAETSGNNGATNDPPTIIDSERKEINQIKGGRVSVEGGGTDQAVNRSIERGATGALIPRRKPTNSIVNAGGTGGGIRQNAKVIKSKNAFQATPWNASQMGHIGSPNRNGDSEMLMYGTNMPNQPQPARKESMGAKKLTEHNESQIESLERETSLIIEQSQGQTHPNSNILIGQQVIIENSIEKRNHTLLPQAAALIHTITQDSLDVNTKNDLQKVKSGSSKEGTQIFNSRPQTIKVQAKYRKRKGGDEHQGENTDDSKMRTTKPPGVKMNAVNPMANAFPQADALNGSIINSSFFNNSMLPQGSGPIIVASVKSNNRNHKLQRPEDIDHIMSNQTNVILTPDNQLTSNQNTALGSNRNTQEKMFSRGKKGNAVKDAMSKTARSNNLRMSHAGGFVFEPHSAKNSNSGHTQHQWNVKPFGVSSTLDPSNSHHVQLPPLMNTSNAALVQQYIDVMQRNNEQRSPTNSRGGKRTSALPVTNQSKIKQVIDELYQKEKRYVRQYIREDLIHPQNTIFNLEKCYKLSTITGVEKNSKAEAREKEITTSIEFNKNQVYFMEKTGTTRTNAVPLKLTTSEGTGMNSKTKNYQGAEQMQIKSN